MKDRLSKIGARQREQHFHLTPRHRCYYWGEYTPWAYTYGRNAEYSETNMLVADLKVSPELRGTAEWERKLRAIDLVGQAFAKFWRWQELGDQCLLVPIPSSRGRDDPLYDDRMEQVVERIRSHAGTTLDSLRLLESDGSLEASHSAEKRPKLAELVRSLAINQDIVPPIAPRMVFLFDDVLTTGAHFAACCVHIEKLFPETRVVGNFVARSKRPEPGV